MTSGSGTCGRSVTVRCTAFPNGRSFRSLASAIKEHTLTHLDEYLDQFEAIARSNGIHVHWRRRCRAQPDCARYSARPRREIADQEQVDAHRGVRLPALHGFGGHRGDRDRSWERIQQLDNEDPSHVVVPAVHKLHTDGGRSIRSDARTDPGNSEVHYLAEAQREATRPLILNADAGMTGCNSRSPRPAPSSSAPTRGTRPVGQRAEAAFASIGIEKIIPRLEHLAVFVRLLSRSALGSPITQYTSHFRGPRTGGEMHVVLVDNGRSERLGMEEFWTSLKCIRCGACMNTCPVYRAAAA